MSAHVFHASIDQTRLTNGALGLEVKLVVLFDDVGIFIISASSRVVEAKTEYLR